MLASTILVAGGIDIDVYDELTKLADLRDRGALTDEEFEREKATLLAKA